MNELSSSDINDILHSYNIAYNGIYQKDMLPNKLQNGFYVVNLQSSKDGNGTHWCALYYSPIMSMWWDSFGFKPPEDIEARVGKYIYNSFQIQDIQSSSCGYYCIAFIKFLNKMKDKEKAFNIFVNLFKTNKLANEKVLNELLYQR
jgi:hypothetical protein